MIRTSLAALALIMLASAPLCAATESGCLRCHGDEATMKRLVAPPQAVSSEGEG